MDKRAQLFVKRSLPRVLILKPLSSHSLILEHTSNKHGDLVCTARFQPSLSIRWAEYDLLLDNPVGCLGILQVENDVFLGLLTDCRKVASIEERAIYKICAVRFFSVFRAQFDNITSFSVDDTSSNQTHPCEPLIKLLSNGSFYFSHSHNLTLSTQRQLSHGLQERNGSLSSLSNEAFVDNVDSHFVWNSFMLDPILKIMDQQLNSFQRRHIGNSGLMLNIICGYIGASQFRYKGQNYEMMILSRVSCKRAGARFMARGVDDMGNVSNFVETEFIIRYNSFTFSFLQIRGSIPVFWEQNGIQINHRIEISRGPEATVPATRKHFEELIERYNKIHVINLLKQESSSNEYTLSETYRTCVMSLLDLRNLIVFTCFDFHAIVGRENYDRLNLLIKPLNQKFEEYGFFLHDSDNAQVVSLQKGTFRTNCLDCLDRTNVVQCALARILVESTLRAIHVNTNDEGFITAFNTLWADNGDNLSRIYAGTGALKSSFTRKGKTSLMGFFDDAAKSVNRFVISNFQDKSKQDAIDLLLGKLIHRTPVSIQNPLHEKVLTELMKKRNLFESIERVTIFVGTFNVNGKSPQFSHLQDWLYSSGEAPALYVIGIQELVQLTAENIVVGDTLPIRQIWETHIIKTLYKLYSDTAEKYVVLRSIHLVALGIFIFVNSKHVSNITHVGIAVKKTGLGGLTGNKGGIAIRLNFYDTSQVFVTAHFAAGQSNIEDRNRDYKTLHDGLVFRGKFIEDQDQAFWFGDFNYRINLSNEEIRSRVRKNEFGQLYHFDQVHAFDIDHIFDTKLKDQRSAGVAFEGYEEGAINFAPTYKYDCGTNNYDTGEKVRPPAWTDRVLYRGSNIKQIEYSRQELTLSDHKPVKSIFEVQLVKVNQEKRNELQTDIYKTIMSEIGTLKYNHSSKPSLPPRPTTIKPNEKPEIFDGIFDTSSDIDLSKKLAISYPAPSSAESQWWQHPVNNSTWLPPRREGKNPFYNKNSRID